MKRLYLVLAILGFVLPHYFFVGFLIENGLDLPLLFDQLFANQISTFFAVDLIITAIVFLLFSYREAQREPDEKLVGLCRRHPVCRSIFCLSFASVCP